MAITLRQLQIFAAVAESGSTAAAAQRVNLTQSASSAALRELESILDCHLFDRVGKRLIINDNGRQLLPRAALLLSAASDIEKDFLGAHSASLASLNLGCSTTIGIYLLPAILASYGAHNNDQPTKITVANTDDIVNAVANFEVDAGYIEGYCHHPDLLVEPWLEDELVIVCAPDFAALQGVADNKISVNVLRESAWLLRERGSGTREAVEHALLPRLHQLKPAAEFSNSESIKNAAAAGLGLACLSKLVVRDMLEQGRLVQVRSTLPPLRRQLYLITAKQKIMSRRLAGLLAFCRNWSPD